MLRKCPGHGFGTDHQVCIFYGGCKFNVRSILDASAGGSLLNRGPEEAVTIIEKMASNAYQWPGEWENVQILKKVETTNNDAIALLAAQVTTMNSKIEVMALPRPEPSIMPNLEEASFVGQGNYGGYQRPFNQGSRPHFGGPQGQGGNQYHPRPPHPNLSYSNPNNHLQPPPGFSVTNGVIDGEKKPKMDELLMAFMSKTEKYMGES
ncbi:hypothetical protein C2S51_006906 [Perilla frutescens var. frutescens]|nr:hypothetical protein C2S51_006906 [Perilla frutescens var. frutescens]